SGLPLDVVVADVDGKGGLDLVTIIRNGVSVLLGNGNGSFQAEQRFTTGDQPENVAVADVNGDTLLDLVVTNVDSDDVSVLLGSGDGSFQPQRRFDTGNGPGSVA